MREGEQWKVMKRAEIEVKNAGEGKKKAAGQ